MNYFERCGIKIAEVKEGIQEKRDQGRQYAERDKEKQEEERWEKIEKSTYWPLYKYIMCEREPQYLGRTAREREVIAAWRCGNETQTWLKGECTRCSSRDVSISHRLRCYGHQEVNLVEVLMEEWGGLKILREMRGEERKGDHSLDLVARLYTNKWI